MEERHEDRAPQTYPRGVAADYQPPASGPQDLAAKEEAETQEGEAGMSVPRARACGQDTYGPHVPRPPKLSPCAMTLNPMSGQT